MVRGGRVRDLPGVHYRLMRGKYDFDTKESFVRRMRRSFYGHKKPKEDFAKYQFQFGIRKSLPGSKPAPLKPKLR